MIIDLGCSLLIYWKKENVLTTSELTYFSRIFVQIISAKTKLKEIKKLKKQNWEKHLRLQLSDHTPTRLHMLAKKKKNSSRTIHRHHHYKKTRSIQRNSRGKNRQRWYEIGQKKKKSNNGIVKDDNLPISAASIDLVDIFSNFFTKIKSWMQKL